MNWSGLGIYRGRSVFHVGIGLLDRRETDQNTDWTVWWSVVRTVDRSRPVDLLCSRQIYRRYISASSSRWTLSGSRSRGGVWPATNLFPGRDNLF